MTNNEYHPNGQLSYTETWKNFDEKLMGMFPDSAVIRHNSDGVDRIRVGVNGQYAADGSIIWEFVYDELGKLISFNRKPDYILPENPQEFESHA